MQKILLLLAALILLCPLSDAKQQPKFNIEEKIEYINLSFWDSFDDEYLTRYVLCALENNHDAKSKVYKSEQFRQQVKYSLGAQLPSLNVAANYLGIKVPLLDNFRLKRNSFILPFQFNYEADLLLKNRDKTKSAKSLYRAQKYDEKTAYIMLVSDVGTAYVNILKFDKTIELQKNLLKNRKEIYYRTVQRYKNGTITKTDLNEQEQELNDIRAELEDLEKNRDFLKHQLCLLIGQSADCACELKRGDIDTFAQNLKLPDEICSDLIFNRPDVISSLNKLTSAGIDVRVAKKEFFPTFNITGLYVFNTLGPGNFFSWRSTFAALLAGASQDIFMGGRKIANLRMSKAKYDELFENYMQSSLNAIKEVNDALTQMKYDNGIFCEAYTKYTVQQDNYKLQNRRLYQGTISYIDLLETNDKLLELRQNFIEKKTAKFVDAISLYKAVGGAL